MGRLMRRRRERGAVAVEAAIILPLLIVLVFGTIEVTLLLRDYVAASSLARSGARVASSEPRLNSFVTDAIDAIERSGATLDAELLEEIWIYEANAEGFPADQDGFDDCGDGIPNCVRYGWRDLDNDGIGEVINVPGGGTWLATDINACLGDDEMDSVGVYVRARHDWVVGFFPGDGAAVEASTVMRFEPVIVPPRPGETNPNLQVCKP